MLREDIERVLTPGMVISMELMLTIGYDHAVAGGYREDVILVITETENANIKGYPYRTKFNVTG